MTDPASFLRARRLANGLTQAQLARRAGTSQAAISRIESGERSPSVDTLARLLEAMGEQLRLEAAPASHRFNRADLAHEVRRPMDERLAGALAWNAFGDALAGAAARRR